MGLGQSTANPRALNPSIQDDCLNANDRHLRASALLAGTDGFVSDPRRAHDLWKTAVDRYAHPESAFSLARLLEEGADGVDKDTQAAVELYRKAVDAGHVEAAFSLAVLFELGADGVKSDPAAAVQFYEQAVDAGHAKAMNYLAVLLYNGAQGVEKDVPGALKLFQRSADAGYTTALTNLGLSYAYGEEGIEKDIPTAIMLFRKAADEGDTNAMTNLAELLESGEDGVEKDEPAAVDLYRKAVDAGDPHAMFRLANMHQNGDSGLEKDIKTAMQLYEKAAESGDAIAMFSLALTYESGTDGVERNVPAAVELYQKAVSAGEARAMNNLAVLLKNGDDGVDKDVVAAIKLCEKAVEEGNTTAMANLAGWLSSGSDGLPKDTSRAVRLLEQAVDAGDSSAMYGLGVWLENGFDGIEKNVAEAVELYRKAVESGNPEAMFTLSRLLRYGCDGVVDKDQREGVRMLHNAVDGGEVRAMNDLAILLHDGDEGVEKDAPAAMRLYERAAEGGNTFAMHNLAGLLRNGDDGVERDVATAVSMYQKAIDGGNLHAMNELGILLEGGVEGIEKNSIAAVELYQKAVDGGHTPSMVKLAHLLQHGDQHVERDPVAALSLYQQAVENGNTDAMCNMANLLEEGDEGIERNEMKAVSLYRKAADAGDIHGMFNLGRVYRIGMCGVSKDPLLAISLFEKASKLDHAESLIQLGILLRYGDEGIRRDIKRARECFERVNKTIGDPYSGILLADLLLSDDLGVERDPVRAVELLENVIQNSNFGFALHELAVLYEKGDEGVQRNPLRAAELHARAAAEGTYEYVDVTKTALRIISAGADYAKEVSGILRKGYSRPKTCLLLTLGGGGRGKTCTMNSIRGMEFVAEHVPTEMASLSKFIVEPGRRWLGEDLIAELDFNDNSLQANASRLHYADGYAEEDRAAVQQTEAVAPASHSSLQPVQSVADETATKPHADVIDRVRRPIVQHFIPRGFQGGVVQVWDMAGQSEYEMAHSLFIARANILVFVTDLKRIADKTTRKGEIRLLCYWMQFAHILVPDPSYVSTVIVGTRKAACGDDVSRVLRILRDGLSTQLGAPVYDSWIRERGGDENVFKFIAIENSQSKEDPNGSGLEDLELAVKVAADKVVSRRDKVPMRWLAFVDKLEREGRTVYSRSNIRDISTGFPGFDNDPDFREQDVLDGLRSFASTGRIVLFELSEEEWFVFTDVGKIIDLVGKVTSPEQRLRDCLSSEDIRGLKQGRISKEALFTLWDGYGEEEKKVMLKLLCQFDLLMLLKDEPGNEGVEVIGVPALLQSGWDDFKWGRVPGERDLSVTTEFTEAMPCGLIGRLMAYLHRTLGSATPCAKLVRADAALLTVKDGGRLFVGFKGAERQLCWKFRSKHPIRLARQCIRQAEVLISCPSRRVNLDRRHLIVQGCIRSRQGCGAKNCVKVVLSESWVSTEASEALPSETVFCDNCQRPWSCSEMTAVLLGPSDHSASRPMRFVMQPREYDVFISHAGPDKLTLAQPLQRALERLNLHCFLDIEELRISRNTAPQLMIRAMGQARIGIFILSPEFAARRWPLKELRHFLWRNECRKVKDKPVLLPVFYRLRVDECRHVYDENSPHRNLLEESGFFLEQRQAECSTEHAAAALRDLTEFSGVEVGRMGGGEDLSPAAVVEEALTRVLDFMRLEGYLD